MADKKTKPPRPPAPNLGSKKRALQSTAISFRYNPLMGSDDDELNEDADKGISFITTKAPTNSGPQLSKSLSLDGAPSLARTDAKSNKQQLRHSLDESNRRGKDAQAVNKTLDRCKEQELKTQPLASHSNGVDKKKGAIATDLGDGKLGKPVRTKSGLMKVPNAILKDDQEVSVLPTDCEEATTDPLSFLDKVMEEQLEKQAIEEEAEYRNKQSLASHHRAKSLDSSASFKSKDQSEETLDIDPCYYTVPAPSELPDEPVIPRPVSSGSPRLRQRKPTPNNVSLSLSGLLATSKDDTEEDEKEISASTQSSRSTLDSPEGKPELVSDPELQKSPSTPTTKDEVPQAAVETQATSGSAAVDDELTTTATLIFLSLFSLSVFIYNFRFPVYLYLLDVFSGMLLMFFFMLLFMWLTKPSRSRYSREEVDRLWDDEDSVPLVIPGVVQSPSLLRSKEQKKVMQKGWMNELPMTYDPDNYHTNQTQSVFVRLDGYSLRLSRPKHNIPRRAMYNEPTVHKVEYVHQRHYDMRDSKVYLLPSGLVKKRLWSKKYPICIELPKKGFLVERKEAPERTDDVDAKALGFDYIQKEECHDRILYLFTRTSRDKEEWFWKFDIASKYDKLDHGRRPIQTLNREVFLIGNEKTKEGVAQHLNRSDPEDTAAVKGGIDFYRFMTKFMPKEKDAKEAVTQVVNVKAGNVTYASPAKRQPKGDANGPGGPPVDWVNAFVARVFWDFLREESWAEVVKTKLQKKLSKLKVPYFIEELKITGIDLGVNAPQLRRVSKPRMDSRGLWVDLDIAYSGSCMVSMETKVNLWRLGKGEKFDREMTDLTPLKKETKDRKSRRQSQLDEAKRLIPGYEYEKPRSASLAALDSEEEDSAESSDEETDEAFISPEVTLPTTESDSSKGSGKIMRLVNKIASSKYFQSATQMKYIKKAIDEVSNTPVELTLEVKQLRGRLCVNIPPPPTDRFWFGFRDKPHLWLSAKPKLGARQVTLTPITDYIEKKLELEFQKVFVLPNMDDLPIPIMTSNIFDNNPV
ncbi:testis-expressed protein 2-like isoform X2 [Asterias amurensis]|uniref:testis-expressed protein 2-like isoform X2 n=1 Tax=Asterias amurensis TaxID=7602 RepID=UPI003AB8A451